LSIGADPGWRALVTTGSEARTKDGDEVAENVENVSRVGGTGCASTFHIMSAVANGANETE
jgi:hypothetical protein